MPYLCMKNIDDEDTRVKFGKHIHKLHTENKYSFKKLNNLTKICISQLQLIEEGKTDTSITYAKTLATAFNLTLSQLFIYDTHPDDLNNTP
ncbi:MAG: hypothetical protein HY841_07005, partial [Bacteroidetes bacterium]|nr:hypothetical protein [Bacteroidota bacterium]